MKHQMALITFNLVNTDQKVVLMLYVILHVNVVPMVDFEPTPVPRVRYSTNSPIPAPRKVVTPAPPKTPQPRDLEEVRTTYIKKVNELFDTLVERFQQLDM